jgi:uncharacterized protein (TIGR02145 family)
VGVTQHNRSLNLPHQVWLPGKCYDYGLTVTLTGITLDPVAVNPWGKASLYKPCTITYNANGGTDKDIVEYRTTNVSYPVGGQYFGRDLYRFLAWTTEPDGGGTTYRAGENITCTRDLTLYAQWYPVFDGMTNCYMVEPGQTLPPFPVSRAFTYEKETFTNTLRTGGEYTGAFAAEVVWQDVPGLITAAVDASPGNQAKVTVTTSNNSGNAVVKIYKAGDGTATPVWSYHIWVTDYPGDNTVTMKNDHVFMDRNLGATNNDLSTAAYGLLYQWGRKDPFAGGVENSAGHAALNRFSFDSGNKVTNQTADAAGVAAGIIESIRNPTTYYTYVSGVDWLPARNNYLWNQETTNNKTIYDPCPAGWRVPAFKDNTPTIENSPWMEYANDDELASRIWKVTGYEFTHKNNYKAYYPAAGYRSYDGGSFVVGTGGNNGAYWSASVTGNGGYALTINNAYGLINVSVYSPYNRAYGFSVRCVREITGPAPTVT